MKLMMLLLYIRNIVTTQSFDKLQNKPFWIWDQQQHRLEDIRTNGYRYTFETGLDIPGKYVERYSFECYDITNPDHPSELSTWQRGIREARTVLYFLSKNKTILEVIRNGPPGSKTTTYQINPPLD